MSSRSFLAVLLGFIALLAPRSAQAFPWFIHHGYVNCAQCHVDPSGAGVLTPYGRAQGEILLRTHYTPMTEEPGKSAEFLFGVFHLPDAVNLQAELRSLVIPEPGNFRFILMQGDLRAGVSAGPVVASASLGVVSEGAAPAWITSNESGFNLVSREYWAGVNVAKGWLIRAGRMNLPFGIRTEDHILFVRSATRTNTNADQQLGASVNYTSRSVRGEVMWIAGNYQLSPDNYRERGYAGYFGWGPTKTFEVGVSSLLTHARLDVETGAPRTRQAHGLFSRAAPVPELAVLAEVDLLLDQSDTTSSTGVTGLGMLDWEPTGGLHLQAIGQYCDPSFASPGSAFTAGGAVQWFFAPRMDLRVDVFDGMLKCTQSATPAPLGLLQAHLYL